MIGREESVGQERMILQGRATRTEEKEGKEGQFKNRMGQTRWDS